MMAIDVPRCIETRLDEIAKRTGRPAAQLAREALLNWLEDAKDVYEAERALRRVRSGRERTYSLDEVTMRLGL